MKVTSKGQVTIPKEIRNSLDIAPNSEVEFRKDGQRVYLVKKKRRGPVDFSRFVGVADAAMTTDELMALTRSDDSCPL